MAVRPKVGHWMAAPRTSRSRRWRSQSRTLRFPPSAPPNVAEDRRWESSRPPRTPGEGCTVNGARHGPAKSWSGQWESNPHEKLGKLPGYHYIMPAELHAFSEFFAERPDTSCTTIREFSESEITGKFSVFKKFSRRQRSLGSPKFILSLNILADQ